MRVIARARRRATGALLAGALLLGTAGTAGCSRDEPGPLPSTAGARAVTTAESEVLALVRFRNFDAGTRSVVARYTDSGHEIGLDGWFDYLSHTGYAVVATDGVPGDAIVWDGATVAISPEVPQATHPVTAPDGDVDGWTVAPLDPAQSRLGALLALLSRLGSDRPENPLLLRQGGALWLRTDAVGGAPVTVFAGPVETGPSGSPAATGAAAEPDPDAAGVRYWVDETGLARRVEARLGDTWATVDLGDGAGRTVPALPADAGAAAAGTTADTGGATGTQGAP